MKLTILAILTLASSVFAAPAPVPSMEPEWGRQSGSKREIIAEQDIVKRASASTSDAATTTIAVAGGWGRQKIVKRASASTSDAATTTIAVAGGWGRQSGSKE
ncbi:MAG: hypothetical protein CYPHOPRED_000820 [Cyphobasidiales sp. Tagirdzhanova-0007]|nr:MAG: hypothetical protein CYPHOPRED_000820 [Cyphobasidiales sp. Tagirdzhanova-0007]